MHRADFTSVKHIRDIDDVDWFRTGSRSIDTHGASEAAFRRAHPRDTSALQKSPRRVHSLLRSGIYSGTIEPDEKLSEEELVREFGASRNSVREALAMLADEGLVTRTTRVGTVVVGHITSLTVDGMGAPADDTDDTSRHRQLDSAVVPSTRTLRAALATDSDTVQMTEFLIYRDGRPFTLYTSYQRVGASPIPFDRYGPGWTIAAAFEASYGAPLAHIDTHLSAVACEARTSRKLRVAEGTPTLLRARLLADAGGEHREYSFAYFVDRNLVVHSSSELVDGVWQPSSPVGEL